MNKRCRLLCSHAKKRNGEWKEALLNNYLNNNRVVVSFEGKTSTVDASKVWLMKNKKKRYASTVEVMPTRPYRYRSPITVVPTRYRYGDVVGNFNAMLNTEMKDSMVAMFNDNHEQFLEADPKGPLFHCVRTHMAGGGNASCRPFQMTKDAIGMPTGPYTSLAHLCRDSDDVMKTAHHFICVAFNRIVDLFLENPSKTTLYYSVNTYGPPNSKRLGLGIFSGQVGEDVIDFITAHMDKLPMMVEHKRKTGQYYM